jgi:hypothetical protein
MWAVEIFQGESVARLAELCSARTGLRPVPTRPVPLPAAGSAISWADGRQTAIRALDSSRAGLARSLSDS